MGHRNEAALAQIIVDSGLRTFASPGRRCPPPIQRQ